jgi:hypothetical protein
MLLVSSAVAAGCSNTPPVDVDPGRAGGRGSKKGEEGGCAETSACVPPTDTPESILAVRDALESACAPCHSGRGGIVRGGFGNIFDVPDMERRGIVMKGEPDKSRLWLRIQNGEMPPANATDPRDPQHRITSLDDRQKEAIRAWIAAGAAPLRSDDRAAIANSTFLSALRADLRRVNPAERIDTRYISLHTYYNDPDVPQAELDAAVNAVGKLLNHLSPFQGRVAPPQQVFGATGEVVALRINLRDYDLDADDWARLEAATEVIDRAAFPCEVPLINADQFIALASTDQHQRTTGEVESLYSNIVLRRFLTQAGVLDEGQLVFEPALSANGARAVEFLTSNVTMLDVAGALGINLVANLREPRKEVTVRACIERSGVSAAIRCIQRDAVPDGDRGFWWSMDFLNQAGDDENANPFVFPVGPRNGGLVPELAAENQFTIAGGEAFWNWPNFMVGYVLYNGEYKLLSAAPQDAVTHPANGEDARAVENAISCFDCHTNHVLKIADEMRPFLANNRQLSAAERGFVEELFPEQDFLDWRYQVDIDHFTNALTDVYLKQGETGELPDGIFKLMRSFERDLNMNNVAAELFSTPDEIAEQVVDSEKLQQVAPNLTDAKRGFISRQNFVQSFKLLRDNVGPNDSILNFCVQQDVEFAGEGDGGSSGGSAGSAGGADDDDDDASGAAGSGEENGAGGSGVVP